MEMPEGGVEARIEDGVVFSPYPDVSFPENKLLFQYMTSRLEIGSDDPVLGEESCWLTSAEVLSRARRYAAGLQQHGIESGTRVCLNVPNTLESVLAMLAITATGASVVLAKPSLTERELLYQVEDSDSTYIITDGLNAEKVLNIHSKRPFKALYCLGDFTGFTSLESFRSLEESSYTEPMFDDPASLPLLYTYTSGTTGLPKGVIITNRSMVASCEIMRACEVFTEADTYLCWNPITHVSGFIFSLGSLSTGTKTVVSRSGLLAKEFVRIVNEQKVTMTCAFPTAFQKLVQQLEQMDVDFPTFKKIIMCGCVTTQALFQKMLKVFSLKSLRNGYGLSEIAGFGCLTPPGTISYSSVGVPTHMTQFKVVDIDTGETLGAGKSGELLMKTPSLMTGYRNKPEATAEAIDKDGWFHTGDFGYYNEKGHIFIGERIKDMIKCLDCQVAPAEVESLLMSHEAVLEAVVLGIPNTDYGEAPTAFVVLKDGHHDSVTEEELKDVVSRQSAVYKHLHGGVIFVDSIPKTDTGKYLRRELRAQYLKQLES